MRLSRNAQGKFASASVCSFSFWFTIHFALDFAMRHVDPQPGLAHVLMTTWALDFESRDYRFLAHESGILPTLQAMVTLTKTAGMATSVLAELDSNGAGKKVEASGGDVLGMDAPRKRWIPWSLETIREGFVQVICSDTTEVYIWSSLEGIRDDIGGDVRGHSSGGRGNI